MAYSINDIKPRILAKLNDLEQDKFSDDVILPYAQDAADELQNQLELNGILALETISAVITIPQGTTEMDSLIPVDLLEPQRCQERLAGSGDRFVDMIRREWEPNILPTDSLRYWTWREQDIFFVGATTPREVQLYYLKRAVIITALTDTISINNSEQFMINRIGGLAAEFSGENKTRADSLNNLAVVAMNAILGIGVKSKQGARTRRRPYVIVGRRGWV